MENNKELLTKIGRIQAEVPSLIKDEKVKHQTANYNYFEESQLLEVLKPLLAKEKITLIVSDDETQPIQWVKEEKKHFLIYLKKVEIYDQDSGQSLTCKFWSSGDNTDLSKVKGSAETYSMKYILSKLFLIRVVDEDDPELKKPDQKKDDKTINSAETEKKRIIEKVILKEDGWYYCKRCETTGREFKLIEKHPNLKLSELKEVLLKHGELANE